MTHFFINLNWGKGAMNQWLGAIFFKKNKNLLPGGHVRFHKTGKKCYWSYLLGAHQCACLKQLEANHVMSVVCTTNFLLQEKRNQTWLFSTNFGTFFPAKPINASGSVPLHDEAKMCYHKLLPHSAADLLLKCSHTNKELFFFLFPKNSVNCTF